jgi:pimeloyl-ACP methyl ester carboxylesterase
MTAGATSAIRRVAGHGIAFTALVSLAALLPACGGTSSSDLTLDSCTVDGSPARCGTLLVPEDRAGGDRQVPVRVVVFPATGSDRQADPVVWFAGGPGDSAVDTISRVRPLLAAENDTRDLVLIEQRGTGESAMTCPTFPDGSDPAALESAVQSCLAGLDGDPRSYTTALFTDDADEVLAALDYGDVNLVGISYGATAEQVFLARHPDRVRTMTLLSGTLLDVPVFEHFPENAQAALENVFAECESDDACRRAFPQLRADWDALWSSVNAAPWVVSAEQSPDGAEHVFDADWVASGLHDLLFVATTQTRIPLLVHTLGTATDEVAAILAIAQAYPDTGSGQTEEQMLSYSIRCNEPWAQDDPDHLVGSDSFEYQHDRAGAEWWQAVCALMPGNGDDAAAEVAPPSSDVPVLALNGENDPQDPPANMAAATEVWPNSLALTVPGQGHDIDPTSAQCLIPLIHAFVDAGTANGLDTSCLDEIPPPSFELTLPSG